MPQLPEGRRATVLEVVLSPAAVEGIAGVFGKEAFADSQGV